ncbi:aminotransferase class IV [Nocardia sp. NBC_00565]|uniref:aminotransferase class IV n=1 Tax=Nocardia sp. NBC_00565 TaxID=2975993 RepID=UPI002E819D8D|nr:aminotransferase class IV [Nocardia sp. NBC_00565]WUC06348.1 aminotransferase class IV [Nocardia sp. NBC_00565]
MTTTPAANPYAAGCAWIEGEFVPIGEARIPILDTGFTRSDLTYDVAAVWKRQFFRLDDHLERLERSCQTLRLQLPKPRAEIRDLMVECVRRGGFDESFVEVVVTRGIPVPGERDPRTATQRLYVYAVPYVWIVKPELQQHGVDVIIAQETIRIPTDAVDPRVKNFHWADLTRGLFEAYDRGATLALMTDGRGNITEGAGFNIFAVRQDGSLITAKDGVLEGITRRTVIEIARADGREVHVGDLRVDDLVDASEVFLTSTAGGVMPVATVDGVRPHDECPGPVTRLLRDRYWDLHADSEHTFNVDV